MTLSGPFTEPTSRSSASQPPRTPIHDVSLDALRIVATLMVLLIHISGKGFAGIHLPHWWAINTWESVSRVCVPLFFMITGALLLPREHSVKSILKRAWRILYVLVAWSIIFFTYLHFRHGTAPVDTWLDSIAKGPVIGHLWYLYALIPAYFVIPVLSSFHRNTALPMQILVLVIWVLGSSMIPFLDRFTGTVRLGLDFHFFYIYPAYILAGAIFYRHVRMTPARAALAFLVWIAATGCTAFFTWFYSKDLPVNTELFYEYFAPLVVIATFALFYSLRWFASFLADRCPRSSRALTFFGSLSFGVYLIHPAIIWEFEGQGYAWNFTNPWIAVPALLLGVSIVSGAITWAVRRTVGLRWLIPG